MSTGIPHTENLVRAKAIMEHYQNYDKEVIVWAAKVLQRARENELDELMDARDVAQWWKYRALNNGIQSADTEQGERSWLR